jgi:cellulose synthase/poly-beta-1,6-N-acetylglucosamine synthase-like glycosyltransferase
MKYSKAVGNPITYYELLEVDRYADTKSIRSAFHSKIQEFLAEPNLGQLPGGDNYYLDLIRAYSVLSDSKKRESYNKSLDYDVVILDSKIDQTELKKVATDFKQYCSFHYYEMTRNFEYFKNEMSESLWLIKSTSLFFFLNVFISIGLSLIFLYLSGIGLLTGPVSNFLRENLILVNMIILFFSFLLFRLILQKRKIKSFKKKNLGEFPTKNFNDESSNYEKK